MIKICQWFLHDYQVMTMFEAMTEECLLKIIFFN